MIHTDKCRRKDDEAKNNEIRRLALNEAALRAALRDSEAEVEQLKNLLSHARDTIEVYAESKVKGSYIFSLLDSLNKKLTHPAK